MPPQPVAPWGAPRDATAFGNICAQVTTLAVFAGPASIADDCLFLNVFTTRLGKGKCTRSRGRPYIILYSSICHTDLPTGVSSLPKPPTLPPHHPLTPS